MSLSSRFAIERFSPGSFGCRWQNFYVRHRLTFCRGNPLEKYKWRFGLTNDISLKKHNDSEWIGNCRVQSFDICERINLEVISVIVSNIFQLETKEFNIHRMRSLRSFMIRIWNPLYLEIHIKTSKYSSDILLRRWARQKVQFVMHVESLWHSLKNGLRVKYCAKIVKLWGRFVSNVTWLIWRRQYLCKLSAAFSPLLSFLSLNAIGLNIQRTLTFSALLAKQHRKYEAQYLFWGRNITRWVVFCVFMRLQPSLAPRLPVSYFVHISCFPIFYPEPLKQSYVFQEQDIFMVSSYLCLFVCSLACFFMRKIFFLLLLSHFFPTKVFAFSFLCTIF